MKKVLKVIFAIVLAFSLVTVSSLTVIKKVHADSGWDSDYDFGGGSDWGGSDWGGSDWSSSDWGDSDWGSSSGGSIVGGVLGFGTLMFWVVVIVIIIALTSGKKNGSGSSSSSSSRSMPASANLPRRLSPAEIHEVDPSLDIDEFKKLAYRTYWDVQQAWMEFDYDNLRKYTTDEIYNMYSMQLDTLSAKGQKNIMKDFFLVDSYISKIAMVNGVEEVDVILTVKFLDYVVDNKNNVVRGSSNQRIEVTYRLTLVKTTAENNDNNFCPNCGAKLEDKASNVCPYCKSVIVSDNYTWVMSKKESLNQRRG